MFKRREINYVDRRYRLSKWLEISAESNVTFHLQRVKGSWTLRSCMFPDRLGGWPWMRIVFNASQVRRSLAEKRNRIVPIRGTLISLPFSSDFLRWAFSSPASSYPYPRKKCKVRRVEENSEGSSRLLSSTETSRHRFPSLWFLRKLIPISWLPDEWILILRFEQRGWYKIYVHRWFSRHFISCYIYMEKIILRCHNVLIRLLLNLLGI